MTPEKLILLQDRNIDTIYKYVIQRRKHRNENYYRYNLIIHAIRFLLRKIPNYRLYVFILLYEN